MKQNKKRKEFKMKSGKITLIVVGIAVLLVSMNHEASSNAGGGAPSCLVASNNSLGPSLHGTVTIGVTNYDGISGEVDFTGRLQWNGIERVYRIHLGDPTNKVEIISAEDITCQVLAADPIDVDNLVTLSQVVGVSTTMLKITNKSLSGVNFNPVPGSTNSSAIAEATIHVTR